MFVTYKILYMINIAFNAGGARDLVPAPARSPSGVAQHQRGSARYPGSFDRQAGVAGLPARDVHNSRRPFHDNQQLVTDWLPPEAHGDLGADRGSRHSRQAPAPDIDHRKAVCVRVAIRDRRAYLDGEQAPV